MIAARHLAKGKASSTTVLPPALGGFPFRLYDFGPFVNESQNTAVFGNQDRADMRSHQTRCQINAVWNLGNNR